MPSRRLFPYILSSLIPVPARDLIGLYKGLAGGISLGPNWALLLPLFIIGRPYPNLPLGYQPYRAELLDLFLYPLVLAIS